jgi:hypothetical protein
VLPAINERQEHWNGKFELALPMGSDRCTDSFLPLFHVWNAPPTAHHAIQHTILCLSELVEYTFLNPFITFFLRERHHV